MQNMCLTTQTLLRTIIWIKYKARNVTYHGGGIFALIRTCEDIQLRGIFRERTLINVNSSKIDIDPTGSPIKHTIYIIKISGTFTCHKYIYI